MTHRPSRAAERIVVVEVPGATPPKGYSNGILARGRRLYVSGQVAWDEQARVVSDDLAEQFAQTLDNVIGVVRVAGGQPEDIVKMTVYVTDVDAYLAARTHLRGVWRDRLGDYYPAMTLVGVARLVEAGAKVEIEAIAELPDA